MCSRGIEYIEKFCPSTQDKKSEMLNPNSSNSNQNNGGQLPKNSSINNRNMNNIDESIKSLNSQKKAFSKKFNEYLELQNFGQLIKDDLYQSYIPKEIRLYINEHKLKGSKYLSSKNNYQIDPILFKDGNIYYGTWNDDMKMEGYGEYYYKSKNIIIEGIWNDGELVYGRYFMINDNNNNNENKLEFDLYEGEVENSSFHGKGTLTFYNGNTYKGDFQNGEMTGKGSFIFKDETTYKGSFKNGEFDGEGEMNWTNGTKYKGRFLDSTLNGEGILSNQQNEKYEGNFDNNFFNGKGKYSYNNGDIYEGNFEGGFAKGKGKLTKNNGLIFNGVWNNNMPNGKGCLEYKGKEMKGYWRNGSLIGEPEYTGDTNSKDFEGVISDIKLPINSLDPLSLPNLKITNLSESIHYNNNESNNELSFL